MLHVFEIGDGSRRGRMQIFAWRSPSLRLPHDPTPETPLHLHTDTLRPKPHPTGADLAAAGAMLTLAAGIGAEALAAEAAWVKTSADWL